MITSRAEVGEVSTTTGHCAQWPTDSWRSDERFSPRSRMRWTLPEVRRQLQQVLLRRVGFCPLCRRVVDESCLPRGPSKM